MALVVGTRLGPYEIAAAIGAGGMGEVYRATDTNLSRQVAIKVLPEAFANDPERLARFEREAKTLAALNHPHIAQIYGLEKSGGVQALVMELVEGPTLADRIAQGAIPIDEALPVAKQIAEALEAAHEQGIIHRDLKPANIKVRPDGTVKVLDFGLAKAMEPVGAMSASNSMSPTITTPAMTQAGMILGTAAYMSPEQARGKTVDKRADIWAFGAVFFEMLTGQRAFGGEDVAETLASVINREPAWEALPSAVPSHVSQTLRLCLRKALRERVPDMGAVRLALEGAFEASAHALSVATTAPRSWQRVLPWAVATLAVLLAMLVAVVSRTSPVAVAVTRTVIPVTPAAFLSGADPGERRATGQSRPSRTVLALSPDGRVLIFAGERGGKQQLFRRALDQLEAVALEGTEGGDAPFFSPDGRWIGFWASGELRKVPSMGGPPATICKVKGDIFGGSWGSRDTIVFGGTLGEPLWEVPATGGTPRVISKFADGEFSQKNPHFLPDGRTVLFTSQKARSRWDDATIAALNLDTGSRTTLVEHGSDARYLSSGHIVFVREGTLMLVPFDVERLVTTGGAVALLADVMQAINPRNAGVDTGAGQFAISDSGHLAYVSGGIVSAAERQLVWVERNGMETPLPAPARAYLSPRLSRDGRYVAMFTQDSSRRLWVFDVDRGTLSPLNTEGGGANPLFSPDGLRVAFSSTEAGFDNLYWMAMNGTGTPERLTQFANNESPTSFSPNGKTVLFSRGSASQADVLALDLESKRSSPVLSSPADERNPTFSPDGHWIAYTSDESGRNEVYVQPYPGPGSRTQVSNDGGSNAAWNPDGTEVFFARVLDESIGRLEMWVVPVSFSPTLVTGRARKLFETSTAQFDSTRAGYDVSRDGQRFITTRDIPGPLPTPPNQIIFVSNWSEELDARVPTK